MTSDVFPGPGATATPMQASHAFVASRDGVAMAQVASTVSLVAACLAALGWLRGSAASLCVVPVLSAAFVRMFVLFHDAGHQSLFSTRGRNRLVGRAFGGCMGISYEGWRTEHAWHHRHQGKLGHRGIDSMNSPMTADEARANPAGARRRARVIGAANVFVLGAVSLLVARKRLRGFFPFRPAFRWPVPNREAIARDLAWTLVAHATFHAAVALALGLLAWVALVSSLFVGAGFGALLFWVQHNFPRTYHAPDDEWSFTSAALRGSSYLRLPRILAWITCDIGLHHVHHLNPRIPNYRLREARQSIPELESIRPLSFAELRACFTRVFWDSARGRMISLDDLGAS